MPLFSNCGEQSSAAAQIGSWDDWAGPEEPRVMEISTRMQRLHDQLSDSSEEPIWQRALQTVVNHASSLVPYVEGEDAYYAPNIAVWEVAWVLALEELHLACGLTMPQSLVAQLYWYEKGHWPCQLLSLEQDNSPEHYVIF